MILRIISLNNDLWIDEVITVANFIRLPAGEILTDFSNDNQHLFFPLLSHFSVCIFGGSAWAIRLSSVLFDFASIIAAIHLATLVYGRRVAVYSELLLSIVVSSHMVFTKFSWLCYVVIGNHIFHFIIAKCSQVPEVVLLDWLRTDNYFKYMGPYYCCICFICACTGCIYSINKIRGL